jgi:indoleamine 2,3-dioxygenase
LALPETYRAWDRAVDELPHYLLAGIVRTEVQKLPLLPTSELVCTVDFARVQSVEAEFDCFSQQSEAELERAYSILSILANSYVWCEGEANPATVLPKQIAVPLWEVSERLGTYTLP